MMMNTEPRITTSNEYWTKERPDRMARLRGLNKVYYNMNIESNSVDEREVNMLASLRAERWTKRLELMVDKESEGDFEKDNQNLVKKMK